MVRFDSVPPSRWANGRGETRELWREPFDETRFAWRLSVATIAGASEFSLLPGVDRRLMNLGTETLVLEREGARTRVEQHEVLEFAGEERVSALSGDGVDLNIMTARGIARSTLATVEVAGIRTFPAASGTSIALIALDGSLQVALGARSASLGYLDCVVGSPGHAVVVDGAGLAALVHVVR